MEINKDLELDFNMIIDQARILYEGGYHKPSDIGCGCVNTTAKGAYRDVILLYEYKKYYFYHQTAVLVELDEQTWLLNNGGYKTKSTKARINKFTPDNIELKQKDGEWNVNVDGETLEFKNRMIINTES